MEILMKIPTHPRLNQMTSWVGVSAIIAVITIYLAGCASMQPPTEQIAVSKAAISSAINERGNEFAPLELKTAMEKMDGAEIAMAKNNYPLARRLAEQAQLDANLAEAKARSSKLQKSVDDSDESNRVLREEIKRTTN